MKDPVLDVKCAGGGASNMMAESHLSSTAAADTAAVDADTVAVPAADGAAAAAAAAAASTDTDADVNSGADADKIPVAAADAADAEDNALCVIAESDSWARSLQNDGPLIASMDRPQQVVSNEMVQRFLIATQLPRLSSLTFSLCVSLWRVAASLNDAITTKSGEEKRDWKFLCPAEVFDNNWALSWTTPMRGPVGDRTSLYPCNHATMRSKMAEKRIALVVAFSLSPFWARVVNTFFSRLDFPADGKMKSALATRAAGAPTHPAGGSLAPPASGSPAPPGAAATILPAVASVADTLAGAPAAPCAGAPTCPRTDSFQSATANDILVGARRPRTSEGQTAGGDSGSNGGTSPDPPRKQARIGGLPVCGTKGGTGGALASAVSLIPRAMLGQARTVAPSAASVDGATPPMPWQVNRLPREGGAFVLRRAAISARRVTVSELIRFWVAVPTVASTDASVGVRSVTMREWADVVAQQDTIPLLLDEDLLSEASQLLGVLNCHPDGDVDAPTTPNLVARFVIEVSQGTDVQRVPYTALKDMQAVLKANSNFSLAFQSRAWLNVVAAPVEPPVSLHDFLIPEFTSPPEMAGFVRSVVGRAVPTDEVWSREMPIKIVNRTGAVVQQHSSWRLTAGDVIFAAQKAWLQCTFIDSVLVELTRYSVEHGMDVHILTCEQFTALLRTPQGGTPTMADAIATAKRLAKSMPPCRSFITMVNHQNKHWCAAAVHLDAHYITFFDPKSNPADVANVGLSIARLRLLANCVAVEQAAQAGEPWVNAGLPWEDRRAGNVQTDGYNCGAFCLQFLVNVVTGLPFHLVGVRGDLLRLVLVHVMLKAGAHVANVS